ncbi:toxin glutamine deamidase domain-containing protein [Nocardia tengchongensis]
MPETIKPPGEARVFNFTVRSAADAASKFGRIRAAQDLIDRGTEEYRSAPALFSAPALHDVAGPAPIMPKMPDPKLLEKIDQKTNPAPAAPTPQPQSQPAPQAQQQPQLQPPASQNPVGTSGPVPTLADLGLGGGVQTAPPPVGSADDLNAVLVASPPAPGQTVALPSGNTTITTGADQTTIVGTTDPITGHNKTDVLDRNGLLIATAESDIVLGSGGLSRDTTITSIGGAVTQVRSVDDGFGHLTTWTANPDGSHSVRYADGTVIKEPAPGSTTPAEIVHLDPDGLRGHVTEYNLDGTTTQADFHPGVLNAPVTTITGPDGETLQVVTVPGHTNGAPSSIITNPDLTRAVLQPDGTTIPIDRYNDMIGGPNYGNQFDPLTGTWRSDPVTARGPIITAPDGTSTQEWTYKNRKGEQRTATATFDKDNNLTALQSGDYTGFDSSTFATFDGITVPVWSGHADAGNVTDDSRLYWDAILTVSGLPELGYRAGLMIGARLIARELAAKGISETGIQLATSTLITRGATSLAGITATTTKLVRDEVSAAGNATKSGIEKTLPATAETEVDVAILGQQTGRGAASETRIGSLETSGDVADGLARSGASARQEITLGAKWPFSNARTNKAIDRILESVNPKFDPADLAYSENCTSCVVTYELRRRGEIGPEVTAGPLEHYLTSAATGGSGGRSDMLMEVLWGRNFSKGSRQDILDEFSKPGSRGFVAGVWKNAQSGHIFNVENVGGKVRFVDAQPIPADRDASRYLDQMDDLIYMRVDDLPNPPVDWFANKGYLEYP